MKTETTDTGIFVEVREIPENEKESEAHLKAFFGQVGKTTIYTILDELEKYADRVFESHGVKRNTRIEVNTPKKIKDIMRSPIIKDAQRLRGEVISCRSRLEKGDADSIKRDDAEWAVKEAFWAGQTYLKMTVRPLEPAAKSGRKVHGFYAKGREAKSKRQAPKNTKVIETFNELYAQFGDSERPSDGELHQMVCDALRKKYPDLNKRKVEGLLYREAKKSAV